MNPHPIIYIKSAVLATFTVISTTCIADQYGPPSSNQLFKNRPPPTPQQKDVQPPQTPSIHPLERQALPSMTKPFSLPGVVGLQDGKWVGTDYLGYLTDHIGIDVEVLKPDSIQSPVDVNELQNIVAKTFENDGMTPRADPVEGPPLPFLHILITIFPIERDKFVVTGNSRLFEQLQVVRKDFVPAGYWQGITWENQDVVLAKGSELNGKVKEVVEKLAKAFATRYRQYNLSKEGMPYSAPPPRGIR